MTWKRVATAAVLIPFAVGLVLWGSTAILAIAVALVTILALFEYFALGEAIGHRGYRFWTATCALLILYLQWLTTVIRWGEFGGVAYPPRLAYFRALRMHFSCLCWGSRLLRFLRSGRWWKRCRLQG
jgi:CDP-diglyceride synthetase